MISLRGSKTFKKNIEKIVGDLNKLESTKINNLPYMRFTCEFLSEDKYGKTFAMGHYYESNGDLVADPDISFLLTPEGEIYPQSFQNSIMYRDGYYNAAEQTWKAKPCKDLMMFMSQWSKNLIDQGFDTAEKEYHNFR